MYAAFNQGLFDGFHRGTAPGYGEQTTYINLAPSQSKYVNSLPLQQLGLLSATIEKNGSLRLHF